MENFASDFRLGNQKGLTAEQYFLDQIYSAFAENTKNQTLPFFNKPDNIPRELSTGKLINDHNLAALEQVASMKGYKSNLWIYGAELNKIQKSVGSLNCKPHTTPVLCTDRFFSASYVGSRDLHISDSGTGKPYQYVYNLDSLDERSQKAVMKYFNKTNTINRNYQNENYKAFMSNCNNKNLFSNENFVNAQERARKASRYGDLNLGTVAESQFKHNLGNSIGKELSQLKALKPHCYRTCGEFIEKVNKENIPHYKAGAKLCEVLFAGTEMQRISVAKGFNLESAKLVEEKIVAESNINKAYKRSSDIER